MDRINIIRQAGRLSVGRSMEFDLHTGLSVSDLPALQWDINQKYGGPDRAFYIVCPSRSHGKAKIYCYKPVKPEPVHKLIKFFR